MMECKNCESTMGQGRVYLSRQGPVVVLLLCGSDKSGQAAAIKQAVAYLNDWRKRGEP